MFSFGLGILSFVGLIALPALYLVTRTLQKVGAWFERQPGPTDRVYAKVVLLAVIGFIIGSFVQPKWDESASCMQLNGNYAKCLLPQMSHK